MVWGSILDFRWLHRTLRLRVGVLIERIVVAIEGKRPDEVLSVKRAKSKGQRSARLAVH